MTVQEGSNTTMKTFQSEFIENTKNILIPALQRDYVQGGHGEVINPFLDVLCSALKGEKTVDLNYIYGSDENNAFVPIDGQQRLITLWILHLYLYTQQEEDFPVKLQFNSREFADNFSEKLKTELNAILKIQNTENKEISDKIKDAQWFVSGWLKDKTVCNMLSALDCIEEKCRNWSSYNNLYYENIQFSFLNMKEKDLTDDIYVKMNGRGRPLSYFENLKSWMEEKIIFHFEDDPNFIEDWQKKIDNEWTDFFWANRDKSQPHPEEIDDEQERFFYNLLRIFWTKKDKKFLLEKEDENKTKENRELLYNVLGIDVNENLEDKIFSRISKKENFVLPLFVLEKTNLFSKEFFEWAKKALDGISEFSEQINTCSIEFDLSTGDKKKTLCNEIFFSNENRELVIMSGIIDYCIEHYSNEYDCSKCDYSKCDCIRFYEWLRFIRNVVCNINDVFNYKNLISSIEKIAQETKEKNSVLDLLKDIEPENYTGIQNEILEEEKIKACLLLKNPDKWETRIKEIENNRYFTGKIKFMFDFLGNEPDAEKFDSYASLMNELFSGEEGDYFNSEIGMNLFSRALLCFTTDYGYGYQINSNWSFLKSSKTDKNIWKNYINDNVPVGGDCTPHNNALKNLIEEIIIKHNNILSNDTLEKIISEHKSSITDWRKFFVEYGEVWKYFNQTDKYIRWTSEYNIGLVKSIQYGGSVYHAELRAYCLYLDYERENPKIEKLPNEGWKIWFYEMEKTCLVFDKTVGENKIAIDVSFDAETATSEDFYQLEIFLRDKEGENTFDHSKEYLKKYYDGELHALGYSESEQGYSISQKSKEAIKQEIEHLLNISFE